MKKPCAICGSEFDAFCSRKTCGDECGAALLKQTQSRCNAQWRAGRPDYYKTERHRQQVKEWARKNRDKRRAAWKKYAAKRTPAFIAKRNRIKEREKNSTAYILRSCFREIPRHLVCAELVEVKKLQIQIQRLKNERTKKHN